MEQNNLNNNNPANREETRRNLDGTFKEGFSGNPSGRPKGSLKDYVKNKLSEMALEEKEDFLKKINPEFVWRMGEGNPEQKSESNLQVSGSLDLGALFDKSKETHD